MAKPENFYTVRYGNDSGELKFGYLHNDGTKSSFVVRSSDDPLHYFSMDSDGPRKGGTINRCPSTYQIKCGDDVKGDTPAFIIEALNGDIVLMAKNGNIRMEAKDVLIKADGSDNKTGNINLEANERINIFAKEVNINGKQAARFITSGVGEITCKTALNIQASACSAASAVSKNKPTKFGLNSDKLRGI
jgi:hypothetical protein